MSTTSYNDIALACSLALDGKSTDERASVIRSIVEFLARRRMLAKAPEILLSLDKIINENDGVLVVRIKSAVPLGVEDKAGLLKVLNKHYSFKRVLFNEEVDPRLIGGIRLEVGDEVIDLSIKEKIKKLQTHLTGRT